MSFVVLETVEVLVSLVAYVAFVWLILLHTHSSGIRLIIVRIKDRESAVSVLLQSLVLVAVSLVIFQAVCISI